MMARPSIKELKEDAHYMYEGMIRCEESADIWQNKLIYEICKAVYDVILCILDERK